MGIGASVDELRVDVNAVGGALHAPFKDVPDAKIFCDLAQVSRDATLVLHHAGTTNHFQIGNLRQVGQDFVLHAVCEKGIGFFFAQVLERKNGDAFLFYWVVRAYRPSGNDCECGNDSSEKQQRSGQQYPTAPGVLFLTELNFFWNVRVTDTVREEIDDANANVVLYFAGAKIMQQRLPMLVLLQILGDTLGQQNVSSVAAIHHPLGHVNPRAGDVGALIDIDHSTDWPAVHPHAQLKLRMLLQHAADRHRTFHRLFRVFVEDQRHPVAGRNLQ